MKTRMGRWVGVTVSAAATLWSLAASANNDRVQMFISQLGSDTGEQRSAAALALGEAGDPRAVAPLKGLLHDEYMDARKSAAWALGQLGDKSAAAPLADVLQKDKGAPVRATAASALGQLRVTSTAKALEAALADADDNVRASSLDALVEVDGRSAAGDVEKMLDDRSWSVRCSALTAEGRLRDDGAVSQIATILSNDDNELVRAEAAHALGKIGTTDKTAIAALQGALKGDTNRVRAEAQAALGAIGGDDGVKTATEPVTPPQQVQPIKTGGAVDL